MREQVRRLLDEDIPKANQPGGNVRQVSATQEKRNADAITARLKRDDPELAEQVMAGRLTANAAA
jgi:hypothetical protein